MGMLMSRMATSGRTRGTSRTASSPSEASPATSSPSDSSSAFKAWRTSAWLSTRTTRVGKFGLHRDRDAQLRSLAGRRLDVKGPADRPEALADSEQPETPRLRGRQDGRRVEAHAVVADEAAQVVRVGGE